MSNILIFAPEGDPSDENTRLSVHAGTALETHGLGDLESFESKRRIHFPPTTKFEVVAISETPDIGIFKVTTPDSDPRVLVCRRAGFVRILGSCEAIDTK